MRFMMHHLRHFGRDDYFGRSSYVYRSKPVLSHKEFLAEQSSEAANQEIIDEEVFHGFNIMRDPNFQALETARLGIRDSIADTIEQKYTEKDDDGKPISSAGEQIIDLSINERLRGILRENAAKERLSASKEEKEAGFFTPKKWKLKGMRNIRNIKSLFGSGADHSAQIIRERFGDAESISGKAHYVAKRLRDELGDRRSAFMDTLSSLSGNPRRPDDDPDQFFRSLSEAAPSHIMEAYKKTLPKNEKQPGFLLFPPMARKRPEGALYDYIDLKRLSAQERNKRLSSTLYDPGRLQKVLNDVDFAPTIYKVLGKSALSFYNELKSLHDPQWLVALTVSEQDFSGAIKSASKEDIQKVLIRLFKATQSSAAMIDPKPRLGRIALSFYNELKSLYDPQWLAVRMASNEDFIDVINDSLDQSSQITPLLNEILGEDILYDLVENHESQALLAHVEYIIQKKGVRGLFQMLMEIKDNLPAVKEEQNNKDHTADEAEKQKEKLGPIQKILDELGTIQGSLADNYIKAVSIGADLASSEKDLKTILEKGGIRTDSKGKVVDIGQAKVREEIQKKRGKKAEMRGDIQSAERSMKLKLKNLFGQLEKFTLDKDSTPKLLELKNSLSGLLDAKATEDDRIFGYQEGDDWKGPKDNPFKNSILGFDSSDFDAMKQEAADNIQSKMKPRTKLTARQLLFKLKEMDMEEKGVTNPGQRQRFALLSTNLMVADAQNKQLYRSTNMELAERLGDTFLGSRALARAGKWFRKNFWASSIYEASDVVNHVTGFDKELKMFRGMSPDITLAELRDLIERNGGISTAKLFEMISKLKEVFQSFELINSAGKVELYDNDAVTMEELIMKLQVLYEEYRTRQFFESVKDKDGSKAELILDLIKENRATVEEEEKGILEQVANKFADWKQWFSKNVLKREFHDKYVAAEEHLKKNKIRGAERQAYLEDQGLAGFVGVLGTGYAVAEAAGVAQKGLGWTWDKLRRGSGWSYGMGTALLAGAWRNILRPIGKYGIVKPAEYLIWKPTKWTAKTAGKIVAFPFVAAGNIVKGGYRWVRS
ncbi:hypothetical protein KC725_02250 [Candidatus Peregrinibacteria bacterium]|nr:hypothetical protein [Candidatus Peregrinibacteria bacterium]